MDEYLPMFLAEGREHLQELNLAVVRIEEKPDDPETVDEIFRIAHSMKGMSATMGFAGMAALTHEMEDVFELLRQRSGGLERAAIDVLFDSLDALSAAVEAIDETGQEAIEPQALIERLQSLVRERTPMQEAQRAGAAPAPENLSELADGRRVVQVTAILNEDVSMPSVRAYMVLSSLAELGETLACRPSPDEVDTFDGREIDAWIVSEHTDSELADAASSVPEVADVIVFEAVSDAALDEGEPEEPAAPVAPTPEPAPTAALNGTPAVANQVAAATAAAATAAAQPQAQAPAANKHAKGGSSTVRVDAERLDQLMHFMGELVLHRTQVEALAAGADVPGLSQAMQNLTRSSHALQSMVMQVRMIPVEAVFLRFPRLVRDLSTKLGKQVELDLVGKDTELDRTVVDALGDPLVHLVRNSLDHGLEGPEERAAAGKSATGTLTISAEHAGGNVVITVGDDGRGIDPARVAQKAAERGLIGPEQVDSIDMRGAIELLFSAGFSTAEFTSRHLRPRRRDGRRARRDPRPRRRGHHDLRARRGHAGADPPAADAGDHGRAGRRGRQPPARDPARPHRADRARRRPDRPVRRGPPDAGALRRGAADRRCRPSATAATRRPTPSTPWSSAAAPSASRSSSRA